MRIQAITRAAAFALALTAPSWAAFTIHLYSPWAADPSRSAPPAFIQIQGKDPGYYPGTLMTADGGDWYSYVFTSAAPGPRDAFKFVSYLPKGGNAYADGIPFDDPGFTMGGVFLTPGIQEAWIIPQGAGKPPLITSIPPKAKAVYLFNPWPETAPAILPAGDTAALPMRTASDPARCGWYVHYFPGAPATTVFRSRVGGETYGAGGIGDARPIDLRAAFAISDTVFILPAPLPGGPPGLLNAFPAGVMGMCALPLAVTIRDFSAKHPDFEKDGMEGALTKGMVAPVLPPDKKPRQGPKAFFQSRFDQWFRTDSTNANPDFRNFETCRDLPFRKDAAGYWGHDSWDDPDHGYFPIDDFNRIGETFQGHYRDRATGKWVDGKEHNFHFCMEMHASFRYRQGQVFRFSGDDDVWVYIDNRLAIDIGGTHGPVADSVYVDTMRLIPGNKYDFDLYFCERKTQGSNLFIQTSIFFEQNQSAWSRRTPEGARDRYDLFEILSGDKSCGAAADGDTVAAPSVFRLNGPGVAGQLLATGISFGGIQIDSGRARVVVDTAALTGLAPGSYAITWSSARSGKGGEIRFAVSRPPPAPLSVLRAWIADRDGNGRIETAIVDFSGPLPALPRRLDFALADAYGRSDAVSAVPGGAQAAVAADPVRLSRVTVTFKVPMPFGLTSLSGTGAAGKAFAQADIPLLDADFPVADSAGPVIEAGAISEPSPAQPLKRVLITLSEPATLPDPIGLSLVFRRGAADLPVGAARIARQERMGDREYAFWIDSLSTVQPIAGDSVALADDGSVRDAAGNAPARRLYRCLEGPAPKPGPLELFVAFANGSRETPGAAPAGLAAAAIVAAPAFVPIDRTGTPLNGPGRCAGCAVAGNGMFAGPVIHLRVPGPATWDFRVFTNTGALASSGQGILDAADLDRMETGGGIAGRYWKARIVWTGRTAEGGKAGTGAYVLVATVRTAADAGSGAPAQSRTWKPRFGNLRPSD